MLKTSIACSERPYLFKLCFNEHTTVMKLFGHKIYCKLKVYESRYNRLAKISTKKLDNYFKLGTRQEITDD